MANPLETAGGPPPAPQPGPSNNLQQGEMPQGGGQAQHPMPAPPSHAETVAALRHFHAIAGELQVILKNPAIGKSDLKSAIIDGVTKLVSERMISPAQAVLQLSQVPDDPIKQRQWAQTMLAQTAQAANAIVDHHAAGHDGSLDWASESLQAHPSPDQHMDHMAALETRYGRR